MNLFEEMDLECEGKLSFQQVMGGEESPLESLFRLTLLFQELQFKKLFRSMDKECRGSISKDVSYGHYNYIRTSIVKRL